MGITPEDGQTRPPEALRGRVRIAASVQGGVRDHGRRDCTHRSRRVRTFFPFDFVFGVVAFRWRRRAAGKPRHPPLPFATLPCQHATCIILDSTMLAFSVALPSPSTLQEGHFAMGNGARRGAKCGGNERGFPSQAQHHHHATHTHTHTRTPRSWRPPPCAQEGHFAMGNGARRGAKCGGNERPPCHANMPPASP